jgi:hypothetical protein
MATPVGESALLLSGSDQFVSIGTVEALGLAGGDFTVEAWIKIQSPRLDGLDMSIVGGGTRAKNGGLHLIVRNGRLHFGFYGNDTPGNTLLVPGAWYHVAFRFTAASGEQAIFLNGVLDAAGGGHAAFAGAGAAYIGQAFGTWFWNGLITEVRIWSEARSEAQIQASMFSRLSGREARLAGYWPLNDGEGAVARDARAPVDKATGELVPEAAIQRRPGALTGASWAASDAPVRAAALGAPEAPVVVGSFDGTSSYITVSDKPALVITDAISVEAWVNPAGASKPLWAFPIASKHGSLSGWELRAGGGQCGFMVTVNKVHQEATAAGLDPSLWYHVAGVYDGQMLRLYVNGVLKTSLSVSGSITQYPDVLSIGRNSYWPDRLFAGSIAEVRLWSRARTQAEIQQAMFVRLTGQEAGLVAQWRLEGDAADASPSKNAGAPRAVRWTSARAPLPATGALSQVLAPPDDPQKLREELAQRTLDVKALTGALERSTAQNDELKRLVMGLEQLRDQLSEKVSSLQKQIDAQKQASLEVLRKQEEIDALNSKVAELAKGGGAQTLLEDFVKNANDEITRAREQLKKSGSQYSLGRVTLDVKMLPGPAGVGMRFPQMDEIKELDSAHLSSLNLEFESQEAKEAPKPTLVTVPSVLDYTEVMARRKLAESNFIVEVSYQAVTVVPGEPIQVDRVVAQFPPPGAGAPSGGTVTIFIGRES